MEQPKRSVGRPSIKEEDKRINTNVWLTKPKYEKIKKDAEKFGLSYSSYCEKILTQRQPKFFLQDYKQLQMEINKIGNNINQIAKNFNQIGNRNVNEEKLFEFARSTREELYKIQELLKQSTYGIQNP